MSNRNVRASGALLIVVLSLLLAATACYSGQVPGLFELTPYYTQTPLPTPAQARFGAQDIALAPPEPLRASFNLTFYPEPLLESLVNSRESCQSNSTAKILYAGESGGNVYYLVDCSGAVGWTVEDRLLGPLQFNKDDLALTLSTEPGSTNVAMLDDFFRPVAPNPLLACKAGTIIPILALQAADNDGDGTNEIYYQIECPAGNKGWVVGDSIFGPLEINIGDHAIAMVENAEEGSEYALAREPGPLTDDNAVTGECYQGSVMEATNAQLVEDVLYYQMTCGNIEGWTDQGRFVGPLKFDAGLKTVIYVPPVLVFEDELPADVQAELAALSADAGTEGAAEDGVEAAEGEEAAGEEPAAADGGEELAAEDRRAVEYAPPLYLTSDIGPAVLEGEDSNVVGRCPSTTVAEIQEYGALDSVYYRITCESCAEYGQDEEGNPVCTTYQTNDGWVEQQYLQGPIDFVPGAQVVFKASSRALETDEETGQQYARIPSSLTGAAAVGQYTEYSGRCPLDEPVEITGVQLETARTSNTFNFYYRIQCEGQAASYTQVTEAGRVRPVVTYAEETSTITGFISARDLTLPE